MKSKVFISFSIIMVLSGLYSCYPDIDDLTQEDLDVTTTIYDKSYYTPSVSNKFQDFQTFVIPDTVVHITMSGSTDTITRTYDTYIIDQVRSNLIELGYTEEVNPAVQAPDIALTISVSTSMSIVSDWYSYWQWYWPDYGKGTVNLSGTEDYYYSWYPPIYGIGSTYSYSSGTIVLEMVDNSRVDPTVEQIPVIWAGLVNGATGGPVDGLEIRISEGIDKCFNQSTYLDKSKR